MLYEGLDTFKTSQHNADMMDLAVSVLPTPISPSRQTIDPGFKKLENIFPNFLFWFKLEILQENLRFIID